ncbi:hypothetical protein LUZ28_18025, partial [Streptomyces albireticuli]|nr:hypothetical protein [Streptomyces albireticuli]
PEAVPRVVTAPPVLGAGLLALDRAGSRRGVRGEAREEAPREGLREAPLEAPLEACARLRAHFA